MFEAVMVHGLHGRLHHRGAAREEPPPAGAPEPLPFRQRDRHLFGNLLRRLVAPEEPAPPESVSFRQRDRRLFGAMGGKGAPAPAAGPAVVAFRQEERRLFSSLVGAAGEPPLPAELAAVAVQQRDRALFGALVARSSGRRAASRGAWTAGAAAFQVAFVSSVALLSAALAARARPAAVEVQLVRAVYRRPAPPPPAAPPMAARRAAAAARPAGTVTVKPRPPAALIQPREIAEAMKAPDPDEPIEEYPPESEGVEGGVVGGVPGYVPEEGPAAGDGGGITEAPRYVTTGFRAPSEARAGCVGSSVRLPPDLAGFAAGQVVVKFAVGRDGTVGLARLVTPVPDPRIFQAVERALASCRWRPGSDAQGQPVTLWVVLPLRFSAE